MRTLIPASAMTVGSIAFQIGLQAGWFNSLTWLAPWAWALSVALWGWWLLSHPKIEKEWLGDFHRWMGRGIHVLRIVLCLALFVIVGLGIAALIRSRERAVSAAPQTALKQSSASPQSPAVPAPAPEKKKVEIKQHGDKNVAVGGSVTATTGSKVQIGTGNVSDSPTVIYNPHQTVKCGDDALEDCSHSQLRKRTLNLAETIHKLAEDQRDWVEEANRQDRERQSKDNTSQEYHKWKADQGRALRFFWENTLRTYNKSHKATADAYRSEIVNRLGSSVISEVNYDDPFNWSDLQTISDDLSRLAHLLPPDDSSAKPASDYSVHFGAGTTLEQTSNGDCSPNIIGGSNTVNCGPQQRSLTVVQKSTLANAASTVPDSLNIVVHTVADTEAKEFATNIRLALGANGRPILWDESIWRRQNEAKGLFLRIPVGQFNSLKSFCEQVNAVSLSVDCYEDPTIPEDHLWFYVGLMPSKAP